jgi:hypothetical protein
MITIYNHKTKGEQYGRGHVPKMWQMRPGDVNTS